MMKDDKDIRYVVLLSHIPGKNMTEELVRNHVSHLKKFDEIEPLVLCGPFSDNNSGMAISK